MFLFLFIPFGLLAHNDCFT
jgi:hypothetical protein